MLDFFLKSSTNFKILYSLIFVIVARHLGGWLLSRRILLAQGLWPADSEETLAARKKEVSESHNGPVRIAYEFVRSNDFLPRKNDFINDYDYRVDTVEVYHPQVTDQSSHVIVFCGNYFSYKEMMPAFKEWSEKLRIKIIGFDYPGVRNSKGPIFSQTPLVEAGIAQVFRLLKRGVPPEKITLYGTSLGGAVATVVAAYFHTRKIPKKVSLINDRSFSNISDYSITLYGKTFVNYLVKPVLFLYNWNLDAKKAFLDIPTEYVHLFVSKDDTIIDYQIASFYKGIKPELRERFKGMALHYVKAIKRSYKIKEVDDADLDADVDDAKENMNNMKGVDGQALKKEHIHWTPLTYLRDRRNKPLISTVDQVIQRKFRPLEGL